MMIKDDGFTVVCVFNNIDIFSKYLKQSVEKYVPDAQQIFIDNTKGKYSSMSQAYNSAINSINKPIVLFAHQDIEFTENFISSINRELSSISEFGVVGIAGKRIGDANVYSNILYGPELSPAGKKIIEPVEVQTLDECLFMMKTETVSKFPFDEDSNFGWHFYCVDKCLDMGLKGYKNYAIGLQMIHHSKPVSINKGYFVALENLAKKYQGKCKTVYTTCGDWKIDACYKIKFLKFKESVKELIGWNSIRNNRIIDHD